MNSKKKIAIYTQRYDGITSTFIYHPAKYIDDEYIPILFSSNKILNEINSPLKNIYIKEINLIGRIHRIAKKLLGTYAFISETQSNYFREKFLENDVKLIHAHFGPSGLEILPLAMEMNIPLIVTFHGYDASTLISNKRYLTQLKIMFEYANFIAVSNHIAEVLANLGVPSERIIPHYIGIPLEKFNYIERKSVNQKYDKNEQISFIQVASLTEKKGHEYTFYAFKEFISFYPKCILIIIGDGQLLPKLKLLASKLGINNRVKFMGKMPPEKIIEQLHLADIFLHHSVTPKDGSEEGIPTSLIEAMATGLRVISTFHAGIPELIDDGQNGYLTIERNIKKYNEVMVKCVLDESDIGKRAADKVQRHFNLINQTSILNEIYKRAIDERK